MDVSLLLSKLLTLLLVVNSTFIVMQFIFIRTLMDLCAGYGSPWKIFRMIAAH